MDAKDALRARVWQRLEDEKAAAFPFPPQRNSARTKTAPQEASPPKGRIPNFVGAPKCATHLAALPEWRDARRVKCNPDAPQRAVRHLALKEGKHVFMAVPRLTEERCFVRLDPRRLVGNLAQAATIKGAFQLGEQVTPEEVGGIDLIVAGSVAVNRRGARVGKGGGYSDLEFALLRELDLVREDTPVLSTMHPLQVVDDDIPMTVHDVPLDVIVTPDDVTRTERAFPKPPGLVWEDLPQEKLREMPPVMKVRERA